ncbi:unnamed protein product [Mesocestoides corti]|uniref:Major facilitator superfamily (MFS) profile domain-containing protein n=1 Tax=Mesocestoides corti TaxID=53468 RepID=A0A158QU43_MESCO|nr:unnamed protein product [Mesocestoides corti]
MLLVLPIELNYPPLQALRRHEFYLLWVIMLCNIIPITLITASFKLVGQGHISDDRFLSGVATASSIFNSGGRIIWGAVCDKVSFKVPLGVILLSWAAILFSFPYIVAVEVGAMAFYAIWVCLLFLCLSGVFVLMPAATGRIFGPVYMAVNYGMVFSAFVRFSLCQNSGSIQCYDLPNSFGLITIASCLAFFVLIWLDDPFIPKRANLCSPCTGVLQRLQPKVPLKPPKRQEETAESV